MRNEATEGGKPMETQKLVTQQMIESAQQVEECMAVIYDTSRSYSERRQALEFCLVQADHMHGLLKAFHKECELMGWVITKRAVV
jgi:hypothetical protein